MFKILLIVAAAFILYKLVMNDKKKKVETKTKSEEKLADAGIMVKDPICGTYVPRDNDIRVKHGDEVHHFCSYECRDAYLKQIGQAPPS